MRTIAACRRSMPAGSGIASSPLTLRFCVQFSRCRLMTRSPGLTCLTLRADGGDPADAFGARRRGQRRLQPVGAAAEPHVGRIDREGQHVEHDLVGGRRADVGDLRAARDFPRSAVAFDEHLFHAPSRRAVFHWPVDCLYCNSTGGEMPDGGEDIRRDALRRRRLDPRALSRRSRWLDSTSPERLAATRHEVDQFYRRHGITFGAYGAAEGARDHDPVRHHPAGHRLGRMGIPAQGPGAAGARAQRLPGRRLRRARDLPRRRDPRDADPDERRVRRRWRRASNCRATCMPISPASTWCGWARRTSTSSRTMCARRRACRTCWRTAK